MFEDFRFRRELAAIQRALRRTELRYRADMQKAREKGDLAEYGESRDMLGAELNDAEDEIGLLETRYLIAQAQRLRVPTPPLQLSGNRSEDWIETEIGRVLTKTACAELRSAIRKERRERREGWQALLGALTGIGGIVVAILSLLIHLNSK